VVEEKNSEDTFTEADKQEIEKLLQEIFTELGIQNTETRINNSFTLSQSQKEKIDSVIKNWVNKKGKASVLTFKKGIPILKEKYSSYEHGIILDYLNISIEKILEFRIIHNISDTSN
jgi:hypothetical protein